jgi:hypothetical protein
MRSAMRNVLRRCVIGTLALVSGALLIGLPAPAISRADDDCPPGWIWSPELNQCTFLLPAADEPGGLGGSGGPFEPGRPGGPGEPGGPGGPGGPGWPGRR